jgi:enoyl-CoA hydratase/carnithine racemase
MIARERLAPEALQEATTGARLYSPHDAVAAGFVTRTVPQADLFTTALAEARRLGDLPDEEFTSAKRVAIEERQAAVESQLEADLRLMTTL